MTWPNLMPNNLPLRLWISHLFPVTIVFFFFFILVTSAVPCVVYRVSTKYTLVFEISDGVGGCGGGGLSFQSHLRSHPAHLAGSGNRRCVRADPFCLGPGVRGQLVGLVFLLWTEDQCTRLQSVWLSVPVCSPSRVYLDLSSWVLLPRPLARASRKFSFLRMLKLPPFLSFLVWPFTPHI